MTDDIEISVWIGFVFILAWNMGHASNMSHIEGSFYSILGITIGHIVHKLTRKLT